MFTAKTEQVWRPEMTPEENARYFAEFKARQKAREAKLPSLWRYLTWPVIRRVITKFDFWDGGSVAVFFLLALSLIVHELVSGHAEWGWFSGLVLLWVGVLCLVVLGALVIDFRNELKHSRHMELYPDDDSFADIDDEFEDTNGQ